MTLVTGVVASLIAAGIVALIGYLCRERLKRWRTRRQAGKERLRRVPALEREVEIAAAYLTHLRDVGQGLRRAHTAPAQEISDRIRHDILEPIRTFVPTQAGEQLKIAWFRPDNGVLLIHREVGHDEDRVATVRLPLGTGIAASAYSQQSTITLGDLRATRGSSISRAARTRGRSSVPQY